MGSRSLGRVVFVMALVVELGAMGGCSSTGIAIRERLGIPKRDQLVDRVQETRGAQEEAKEQFVSTLDELKMLSGYEGGQLEAAYRRMNGAYERAEDRAQKVRDKIDSVQRVADALFEEWEGELKEYSDRSLRRESEKELERTRDRYRDVLGAMRRAEDKMDPVLAAFHDQVLFLKHNLNARAVGSLDTTLGELEGEIASLIEEMEASIAEANAFVEEMGEERQ